MADFTNEISNETKLQIAQHFLLSSPPGQFTEVLNDTRKLLPEGLLSVPLATGIARAYNIKNGKVLTTPNGEKVPLCSAAEIDPTHYLNPIDGTVYGVDHLTLSTFSDSKVAPEESSSSLFASEKRAIQQSLKVYLDEYYLSEEKAAGVFVSDNKLLVVISGEKPNLRNYWSGRFSSTWTIELASPLLAITGEIKIHAHYFEDGNVQLQTQKNLPRTTLEYSTADIGTTVINYIKKAESAVQAGLEEMYVNMNDETFKTMRRLMPVTKSKMEWNVNAVRMVHQIRK